MSNDTAQAYGQLLRRAADHATAFLETAPERAVGPTATREQLEEALGGPLPTGPTDVDEVLTRLIAAVDAGLMMTQSPRFFGFVIGGSHPIALATDWLTSTWDQNAGLYVSSPAAAVAEVVAGRWLLELLRLPAEASVGVVTGGQMATWTCLAAALHHVLSAVGWDVEQRGLTDAPRIRVVVGQHRHGTVDRALRFLGLGHDSMVIVACDEQGQMDVAALEAELATADVPTIIVAQAGDVNTGAVDPMIGICQAARQAGAWVHVDGAFGLWAQASLRRRHLTEGVEGADSWSVDAHKWLNVPFDSGLAIVRHRESHAAALGATGAYLVHDADAAYDPMSWAPEHSRRARGMVLWATIQALGSHGVRDLVDRLCDRAQQFAAALAAADGVEVLNEVVLNQVLVRFTSSSDPDAHTRQVIHRVQQDGTCWLGGTTWRGHAAMRISVSNWATTHDDVLRSVDAILRCAHHRA